MSWVFYALRNWQHLRQSWSSQYQIAVSLKSLHSVLVSRMTSLLLGFHKECFFHWLTELENVVKQNKTKNPPRYFELVMLRCIAL